MIVDLRTYTVKIGRLKDFLTLYMREGLPLQHEHLGEPMGYYTTEVGDLAEVVHLWQYTDMADRERRRNAMETDPRWIAYRGRSTELGVLIGQRNLLLKKVDFGAFEAPPMCV